jgi:Fe-S cluster assembly scaffold protein SufB
MNSLPFLFAQVANLVVIDQNKLSRRSRSATLRTDQSRILLSLPPSSKAGALTVVVLNQIAPLTLHFVAEPQANREVNLFWYVKEGVEFANALSIDSQEASMLRFNAVVIDEGLKTDFRLDIRVSENATADFALSTIGGIALTTTERVRLEGEGATFLGHGLTVVHKQNAVVLDQRFEHLKPFTKSEVVNYAVANDQGKIRQEVVGKIHKGNHGSVCRQQNRGVILKEGGSIQVDPYLLIDEYDVEAGHGAAVGQIDPEELYYLQSRGLDEAMAKQLIITGYVKPLLDRFTYLPYGYYMEKQIERIIKGESTDGEPL